MKHFFTILIALTWVSACGDDASTTAGMLPSTDTAGVTDTSEATDLATADTAYDTPETVQSDDGSTDTTAPQDASQPEVSDQDTSLGDATDTGPPPVPCTPNTLCDDNNPCTYNDSCTDDGLCSGTEYACDDGRSCTDDICQGNGDCAFEIQAGTCLIGNICYDTGEQHVQNDCVACDPDISQTEWALTEDGIPCGDDEACLLAGTCTNGQCDGALIDCDDTNPCTDDYCDVQNGCVNQNNFDPCNDGDACTLGDACTNGVCTTGLIPLECDDDNECTQDECAPMGCVHLPVEGACSDGSACTVDDVCEDGTCVSGETKNCDDGNLCTIDTCDIYIGCVPEFVASPCCVAGKSLCDDQDPCTSDDCDETQGTCVYSPSSAACDDEDPCTSQDTCADGICGGVAANCDDSNPCTADTCISELGGCQYEAVPGDCNDGNACTSDDLCIGGTCTGAPISCNDGNSCTVDGCDPISGCTSELLDGPCDDFNLCTLNTVCTSQGCAGDAVECNDNNPCTNDVCNPTAGCQYQPIAAPCDDGLECSTGDVCISGQCIADTSECGCIPTYSDLTSKLTSLLIGTGGEPGQGLDVDGDPMTCAPAGQCSGGIDNNMSVFSGLGNPEISDSFDDGDVILLFNHVDFNAQGQPYTLNFFAADEIDKNCDVQTSNCAYELDPGSVNDETCTPHISFDNTVVLGNTLKAGGTGYSFPFSLPVEGIVLSIAMENAQLEAQVTYANGTIATMEGILAGAVAKESIADAVDQIPDSEFPPEIPKETVKTLISLLITNDIDTNGDGTPDAASIGITFSAIQGTIVGIDL